jgi:hypothetical protein
VALLARGRRDQREHQRRRERARRGATHREARVPGVLARGWARGVMMTQNLISSV